MIIVDMLPFSTVENKGFRSLISTIEPLYTIPSRKSITTRIEKMYIDKSQSIRNIIENINYISLTTDGWTSTAIDSYLTFTAHYFDDNWKLYSVTLSIEEIQESHTAENLKDSIMNVIESWNLNNKITGISHDNAANISNAVKLFYDQDIYSNRCAAHTLQLAVKKCLDLNTCRPLLKTASKIVASFRQSSKRTYALENYLAEKECKKLNLVQSCPTRWNSTLDMLERLLELRSNAVVIISDRTLFNSKIAKDQELLEEDWEKIEILVTLLKPLKTATTVLCADQNVTISMVS